MKLHFRSFGLGLLAAGVFGVTIAATNEKTPRTWEYTVMIDQELPLTHSMQKEFYVNLLNGKAAAGWETVCSQILSTNETSTIREITFRRLKP